MKKNILLFLSLGLAVWSGLQAQISHGGNPRFLENSELRAAAQVAGKNGFVAMPPFNLDSVLQADELSEHRLQRAYPFAYKFVTHIERGKDGTETVLDDGTLVWQVGIASSGAHSINLLFTEFDIPEGGQLFIYSSDRSHVIGSFDARNNSPEKMLPTRPVLGESIIVEYSEPAHTAFRGRLVIGEVNHDYRGVLRAEPNPDNIAAGGAGGAYLCMPDALCDVAADARLVRASVLLIVNGGLMSSGTLINNTQSDGTPYVLTNVHCINASVVFPKPDEFYQTLANTAIAFFNYNRPLCGSDMKGTEEMSLAGAYSVAIMEGKDIALLRFKEAPPDYYNAYFAGWNAEDNPQPPFTNYHHPYAAVTKYGLTNNVAPGSDTNKKNGNFYFDRNSHWKVEAWNVGSTHPGSSGSALFDQNGLIVGGLTSGASTCRGSSPGGESDYFSSLNIGWAVTGGNNALVDALDPEHSGATQVAGFDPHFNNPFRREQASDVASDANEVTRTFTIAAPNDLFGVFVQMPSAAVANVEQARITVYTGEDHPAAEQLFKPQFVSYAGGNFALQNKTMTVASETFIAFDPAVPVGTRFYVTYQTPTDASSQVFPTDIQAWLRANDSTMQPNVIAKNQALYYKRAEHRLIFSTTYPSAGTLSVYSMDGRLIEKQPLFVGQQEAILKHQVTGTQGIVRTVRGGHTDVLKIIY
ncbi:lysyl endopeptidase [Candidatus Symbiothrix dinenymphae]|nr:lysyl endopeptidase [Candidatus Symbiothrix dinenymphae]